MRPQDIIAKKRDGDRLSGEEISAFIRGVTDGTWADYQVTALIMAMFLNELDGEEQSAITQAMLHSGEVLDFSDLEQPKADKHSTGGVGDKTSLIIAPLAAACGVAVPMISGRGLEHTGGTLDKLESINGYNVDLSIGEFKRIVRKNGFAMTGQTSEIVPADKKIYALRDATATVPTIPLIVASIMSKKLAEGLDALVLDVKTGNGAFMPEFEDAVRLGAAMAETGNSCGVKTKSLITDMNQPLGRLVGNALEVYECLRIMRGEADEKMLPTRELSVELSARMLTSTNVVQTTGEARTKLEEALDSGRVLEKFKENIKSQGGDPGVCDDPGILIDRELVKFEVKAERNGFISSIATVEIGKAVSRIGGGRVRAEDSIDHAVGYSSEVRIGDAVRAGDPLGVIYCRNEAQADSIAGILRAAHRIEDEKPDALDLVKKIIE